MNNKFITFTIILIATFLVGACTITIPSSSSLSFDDQVATQAAVVFTATALAEQLANPTNTPQPEVQPTAEATPEPTATLPGNDPAKDLGEPDARDTLSNSGIWFKNSTSFENEFATFTAKPGSIQAVSKRSGGPIWYDYFEKRPANIFLQGKLTADSCSGSDSYGILFRGEDIGAGPSYFFSVSCNGKYSFYTFGTSENISYLEDNQSDPAINTGSGAVNTLGIWADGSRIRLYVNGVFIKEVDDNTLTGDGYVGFFIWSVNGAGLSVSLDEIAYWTLS